MNNPARLFMALADFSEGTVDTIPNAFVGKYLEHYKNSSKKTFENLVKVTKKISGNKNNSQRDVYKFLQGYLLSQPYDSTEFLNHIQKENSSKILSLEMATNNWLREKFNAHHSKLAGKLEILQDYEGGKDGFRSFLSTEPNTIKKYVERTNACIHDNPLNFFTQVQEDPGTIYLLGIDRNQEPSLEKTKGKEKLDLGYIRLYAFQDKTKTDIKFIVDNVFINNGNKNLLCSMLHSISEIASYLDVDVLDKTISINYLNKYEKEVDIYNERKSFFKLGNTPEIQRYTTPIIPEDNEGFFILNKK